MSKQRITGSRPNYTAPRERYGKRIFARGVELLENTKVTGLNNNVLVIGNSGCGKTGSYICSVLSDIKSSVILQDVKGLLYDMFSGELRAKGYNIIRLDFTEPEKSQGYNPLAAVKRNKTAVYTSLTSKLSPTLYLL